MRRRMVLVLVVLAATLSSVGTAGGVETCLRLSCSGLPTLVPTFDGSVSPRRLPRNEYVPVTVNVLGKVATSDGTHPPALREAVIDIDKDVKVNAKGYPVCKGGGLDIRDPSALKRICRSAILGEGEAEFEIAFPEQRPIKFQSPVTVFNGGEKGGKVTLLIHTFITVPAPTAIVTTVMLRRNGRGIHAVAKVPVIAGGSGSLLSFSFKLGKTYSYKGKKVGYLEAKCPDSVFKVSFPELLFRNEAHTPGQESAFNLKGALAVPCTPKG